MQVCTDDLHSETDTTVAKIDQFSHGSCRRRRCFKCGAHAISRPDRMRVRSLYQACSIIRFALKGGKVTPAGLMDGYNSTRLRGLQRSARPLNAALPAEPNLCASCCDCVIALAEIAGALKLKAGSERLAKLHFRTERVTPLWLAASPTDK